MTAYWGSEENGKGIKGSYLYRKEREGKDGGGKMRGRQGQWQGGILLQGLRRGIDAPECGLTLQQQFTKLH